MSLVLLWSTCDSTSHAIPGHETSTTSQTLQEPVVWAGLVWVGHWRHGLSKIGGYTWVQYTIYQKMAMFMWKMMSCRGIFGISIKPNSIEAWQSFATTVSRSMPEDLHRVQTPSRVAGRFSVRMLNCYTKATAFCPGRTSGWVEFLDWTMTFTAYPATKPLKPGWTCQEICSFMFVATISWVSIVIW